MVIPLRMQTFSGLSHGPQRRESNPNQDSADPLTERLTELMEAMMLDTVDKGRVANESDEMRKKREAMIAKSPPPQPFRLRAELLKQGRSNQKLAATDNMWLNLKVYASGGENGLHNHTDEDHFHLVLSGSACFFGPRGEELHCGQYEGVLLPAGCFYRFHATSGEPLVLLRVGARVPGAVDDTRFNIYGDPLPSDSKENGRVDVIKDEGVFWGARAK